MKTLFIFILCLLVLCNIKLSAQVHCDVDSIYYEYDNNSREIGKIGYKVIQSKQNDKSFITLSIDGLMGITNKDYPRFILSKINPCGTIIWQENNDSESCMFGGKQSAGIGDIWEENNGDIVYSRYFYEFENPASKKGIRLIKTDPSGMLKWNIQIGDTTKFYTINSSIKINENKYLFAGNINYYNPVKNLKIPIALMTDTFGNILYQDSFTTNRLLTGTLLKAYKVVCLQTNLNFSLRSVFNSNSKLNYFFYC